MIHSHNYTAVEYLRRNFDLGVSQADHPEVFSGVPSEGEGVKLVKATAARLKEMGKAQLIPKLVWVSAFKYMGLPAGEGLQASSARMDPPSYYEPGLLDLKPRRNGAILSPVGRAGPADGILAAGRGGTGGGRQCRRTHRMKKREV